MNIFEEYKDKIISIIKKAEKDKMLILSDNLNSVNVDSTPPKIDFDISTNVSMVLAKPNNKSPNDLGSSNQPKITFARSSLENQLGPSGSTKNQRFSR